MRYGVNISARPLAVLSLFAAALCSQGCAATLSARDWIPACENPVRTVKHELYFGLELPDGGVVSENEFASFVDDVVVPRFANGLTLLDADGQYRNNAGELVDEATKVLILIYPDDSETRGHIERIVAEYGTRFQQESVGWVRTAALACLQ